MTEYLWTFFGWKSDENDVSVSIAELHKLIVLNTW